MKQEAAIRVGDEIELTIASLAFGGEGVARVQQGEKPLVVFVEDVVPGEQVKVRIVTKKRNFARGIVQALIKPAEIRVKPKCKHFGPVQNNGCGGCTWQFLDAAQQLHFKEQQVREALQRIGNIQADVVLPIIGGQPWYYRNKMEFSFSRTPEGELSLGLHVKRRHYDVIELTECFLQECFVGELVQKVRTFFQKLDQAKSLDPEMRLHSFTIRVGKNTGQIMLIITAENGKENFMEDFKKLALDFAAEEKLNLGSIAFVQINNYKGSRKTFEEKIVHGKATIEETLHLADRRELRFEISPQAFFQPNTSMAEVLYAKAVEAAGLTGKETVFDLYCGTGTIGLFCAGKALKVYGIELNASAVENARANAKLNGIDNIEFVVGDVQQALAGIADKPDVVMVDPPRNGLAPKVVEMVADYGAPRIVYISCNPTSLARDAALFGKRGYTLISVQPVDMFPQTYHIENVALFNRN